MFGPRNVSARVMAGKNLVIFQNRVPIPNFTLIMIDE